MKLIKPKFWDKKYNFFSIVLLPFTFVVLIFIFFKNRFTKSIKFDIPIICVGNIYVGGTGKTPSSILIANELSKLGKNPAIVRKFYEDHQDEHSLIKENFKSLILCENRIEGIAKAKKLSHDSVILDDGFQDLSVKKINAAFQNFSKKNKVLKISQEKLVSIDFNHNPASSIVDASLTNVVQKNMGKISAWYDNEWGFSNRMCDIVEYLHKIS